MYGYSDADWATMDIDERCTFIRFCLFLSGAVILVALARFWKPNLSSMESELGGLTEPAKNTNASRELMAPSIVVHGQQGHPTHGTKQATDNPRHHSRAKHMETFLAWVGHLIQEGHIRTQNIPRDDNVADFMVTPYNKAMHRATWTFPGRG
jgi:hypothetical protein